MLSFLQVHGAKLATPSGCACSGRVGGSVEVAGGVVGLLHIGSNDAAAAEPAAVQDLLRVDGVLLLRKLNEDLAAPARLRLAVRRGARDDHVVHMPKLPNTKQRSETIRSSPNSACKKERSNVPKRSHCGALHQ